MSIKIIINFILTAKNSTMELDEIKERYKDCLKYYIENNPAHHHQHDPHRYSKLLVILEDVSFLFHEL